MPTFLHPIEPFKLTQGWGTYNPAVYSQFGFTRHNGLDLVLSPDKHIVSPFKGTVVRRGFQPNGGGIFIGIVSDPMDYPAFTNTTPEGAIVSFPAGTFKTLVDLLHCESIQVNEGDVVEAGQLVAIGDNTGFSTGPHCHSQWRRVTWDGKVINTVDVNDANNSFDPTQFFPPAAAPYQFNTDFGFLSRGVDVQELQKRFGVLQTGFFWTATRAAVKGFQSAHGIPATGYVGPLTRAALNS